MANRVAVIHDGSTPTQWRHVKSELNPADDASRGLTGEEMINQVRWFKGPQFLWKDETEWPNKLESVFEITDDDLEVKRMSNVYLIDGENNASGEIMEKIMKRRSSWYKLKVDVAWWLIIKNWLRSKTQEQPTRNMRELLHVDEIYAAEMEIVRYLQRQEFNDETKVLQRNKINENQNKIKKSLEPWSSERDN